MQLKQLKSCAAGLLFGMAAFATPASLLAQNSLLIPGLIEGGPVTLDVQTGSHTFYEGISTDTYGANGPVLGPTVVLTQGEQADLTVINNLPDTTTMHWHGLHVASENDGGPFTAIAPGASWNPVFEVMDEAGTYWYHPHLHHSTNFQVSMGISGMIWVRDAEELALDLPRTYGVDEFPIIIQTKHFDEQSQIVSPSRADDVVMVNATLDAVLEVPAQVVRFHMLNASSERVFNLGLEGDETFQMIATEGGLLEAPLELQRLRMAPGERSEWLLNLTGRAGDTLRLMSFASEFAAGIYGATNPGMMAGQTMTDYSPNALNGSDFTVLTLVVNAAGDAPVTAVPTVLDPGNAMPWTTDMADEERTLTMAPTAMGFSALDGSFTINGLSFDHSVINYTIPLDNIEIWTITNNSPIGHPFHIHDVQFYILDRNGVPPVPEETGRKDVVFVPAMTSVRFMCAFEDFANPDVPFMYHCHMLVHEDGGMMGSFVVVGPDAVADVAAPHLPFDVYPNPASDHLNWNVPTGTQGQLEIHDAAGRRVMVRLATHGRLNISSLPHGLYTATWVGTQQTELRRFVVR